jgi:hypothetical protein
MVGFAAVRSVSPRIAIARGAAARAAPRGNDERSVQLRALEDGGRTGSHRWNDHAAASFPVNLLACHLRGPPSGLLDVQRRSRLGPEAKRLLQAAAVIGKDVAVPLLLAIADAPEPEVRAELAHLQAAEFLYETRLFPDLEYTFKHALTHEVAYQGLLHDRQRALHARITEALERLAPERVAEQAEQLAHHALHGELWDKAAAYFRQAGLRAAARAANREAIAHLEQALGALRRLPETRQRTELTIDIHLDLFNAFEPLDWTRMREPLHEAEVLARALGDPQRLARIATFMVGTATTTGSVPQAMRRRRLLGRRPIGARGSSRGDRQSAAQAAIPPLCWGAAMPRARRRTSGSPSDSR